MMRSYKERFGKSSLKELIEVPQQMTLDLGIPMTADDDSSKKSSKKSKKASEPQLLPEDALKQIVEYAAEVANTSLLAAPIIEKKLANAKMLDLMNDIEMPLLSYILWKKKVSSAGAMLLKNMEISSQEG